ncbi:YbcC family protein [Rhodoplanes sp. SY1]|uniref:YbcC family protein n=1 Tax=Rhodoplanes sp. SY1 TaxID=3166646 RepID=UPI0038B6576A
MIATDDVVDIRSAELQQAVEAASRRIPPLWPLASSVAVNPFMGQSTETLAQAGTRLARVGGVPVVMPRTWFRDRIATGVITDRDLADALAASPHARKPADVAGLKAAAAKPAPVPQGLPTIADLAGRASGFDWTGLIGDRISVWAGSHFDQGQALWPAWRARSTWSAWRAFATHDLTAEIHGLTGFGDGVAAAPESPIDAIAGAARRLGLTAAAADSYFHQLLLSLGGWSQYGRYVLWRAELEGGTDSVLTELLAIRLVWEDALHGHHAGLIETQWEAVRAAHAAPVDPGEASIVDEILQEAAERAAQRRLAETLAAPASTTQGARPTLQAAFCIDVRSEVFRRALEQVDPSIRTLGFAGFFGVFAKHRRFASDVEELRLPVLLNPTVTSTAGGPDLAEADRKSRYKARAHRAWGRFKLAAVSCFAFVEAMGPVYVWKNGRDALALAGETARPDPKLRFDPDLDPDTRLRAAETVLRAMSLTSDFARVVLLVGHGATVTNNPHASALHCGACGGYTGDVNARLLALLLGDPEVRDGLAARGIVVPNDTVFVAAMHDTTTDEVTLYDTDEIPATHGRDLDRIRSWLKTAGTAARAERALRLPGAGSEKRVASRARDWAELRPEWGLAGCQAFIAAPRARTAGRGLAGRAFLHDYDWRQDSATGFGVLELIMTAPVVVASWISLQYYGSTVAPATFGAGDKLLHNVVGGIGVFEGNGGVMRTGLPLQSVHDGEDFVHEPLRLTVCIEAPAEAMTDILVRHDAVRALFDNRWTHLFEMDQEGRLARRYAGDLTWEPVEPTRAVLRTASAA